MESKTAAQKIAKVIVFGFVSLLMLTLFLLFIAYMHEEFKQALGGISFRHWLAGWLYIATVALALVGTAKWVEKNLEIGMEKQLSMLPVYGFVALAWVILSGLPIRFLIDTK